VTAAGLAASAGVVEELRAILGDPRSVLTDRSSRFNRARVPAPFPVHRWDEHLPDVVVLPRTTEEVAAIVKLADREGIPVVPRAGGTGLADGAVPVRGGICVDVKLMDQIHEVDLENYTVTVGPGINMQTLNRALAPHGVIYPDAPASYPCSLVGGRIGTNGWSQLGTRYGHTRDLVISFKIVLPSGEVMEVGEGGAPKVRKSSTSYPLKQLFMGHQGTLGIVTEATLELVPKAEAEFSAFFAFADFDSALETMKRLTRSGLGTLAIVMLFDEEKIAYLRRDDEAYIGQPDWVVSALGVALLGARCEVEPASRVVMEIGRSLGGRYMGDEISAGDWAARHDRYANPLHGRLKDGQVVPMTWHCEDAAAPYDQVHAIRRKWHEIANRYAERYDVFDNWGMFVVTNGGRKPWGDALLEIDMGLWEQRLDDETWGLFIDLKREIAEVVVEHGGTISCAHGATRAGDRELIQQEIGPQQWELMKQIKRLVDPHNIMNPGKMLLDDAYGGE
jgi:glycolate oxidase